MIKHIFALLWGCIFGVFLFSCSSSSDLPLGQELVNMKTNVISTDTCTVRLFTFKEDSIRTSGTGRALVGNYFDKDLGYSVASNAYFEMGVPSLTGVSIDQYSVFDSISLCLHYAHYSYGDTSQYFTVKAYSLKDSIGSRINNDGYLYNTSHVAYSDTSLYGEATIIPRPSRPDSMNIKLPNWFGNSLFTKIQNLDPIIQMQGKFVNYFKGFALVPGGSNKCVLGFAATDTGTYIRLYYHVIASDNSTKNLSVLFKLYSNTGGHTSSLQFNNIAADFGSGNLNTLVKQENMVSSSKTGNQSFCQGGTGMITRLEFPYLKQLLAAGSIKILKASLVLSPVKNTYNLVPLPSQFNFYIIDNLNVFENAFVDSRGSFLTGTWAYDYEYNENTTYTFDVTSFITSAINQTSTIVPAIGISLPSTSENNTLQRVVFGDNLRNTNVTKLKITYWRYQTLN